MNIARNFAALPTITEATATNAVATATAPAPAGQTGGSSAVSRRNYIQAVIVSASAAVAAATTLVLKSGANTLLTINLSTTSLNVPLVLDFKAHPIACNPGETAVAVLGALGAAVIGNVQLLTFIAE